jgi:hypothetical protein
MSELFQIYQENFNTVANNLKRLISTINTSTHISNKDYDKICENVEKNFKEIERILKIMDLEINLTGGSKYTPVNNNNKNSGNRKIYYECKSTLDDIVKTYKKEKENYVNKKKEESLGMYIKNNTDSDSSQNNYIQKYTASPSNVNAREKLLSPNNEEITVITIESRTEEKLNHCKRSVIEMENISENIKSDLYRQSDDIRLINNKVANLNNNIDTSNSLIKRMTTRGNTNKKMIALFSFALICMFVLILYSRN